MTGEQATAGQAGASGAAPRRDSAALLPLIPQAYVPQLLWAIGQGAMFSVLALVATGIGASTSIAALIVAMSGLGTVVFDLPSGRIIARFGEFASAWMATIVITVGLLAAYVARTPLLLGIAVFVVACGWGIWNLKVLTHLSRVTPLPVRGRALALIGGVSRVGTVVGPLLLALVIHLTHEASGREAFLIFAAGAVLGEIIAVIARDRGDHEARRGGLERIRVFRLVRKNLRGFLTAATGTFGISMLRGSRQAILPLWGHHIGLSLGQIAFVFGISSLLDVAFFYPAGIVSDRFGRKIVAVPCITLLALGHVLLPFTHDYGSLFAVALLLGFGNSLGSGIVMTLGADQAPAIGRASFLAVWRLVGDSGMTVGPFLVALFAVAISLAAASVLIGLLGFIGAAVLVIWMQDRAGVPIPIS